VKSRGPAPPWRDPRYWIQAAKALVLAGPVFVILAIFGSRVLVAACSATAPNWCDAWFVAYVVGVIVLARFFYSWFKPKDP
jgi:hypothetical protein